MLADSISDWKCNILGGKDNKEMSLPSLHTHHLISNMGWERILLNAHELQGKITSLMMILKAATGIYSVGQSEISPSFTPFCVFSLTSFGILLHLDVKISNHKLLLVPVFIGECGQCRRKGKTAATKNTCSLAYYL